MCDALAGAGYEVTLMSPTTRIRFAGGIDVLRAHYGIKGTFTNVRIWEPQMRGGGWLHDRLLRLAIWWARPDLIYGRHLHDCLIAAQCGYPTVHETHMPVWNRDHDKFQNEFEALISQAAFRALVVVSNALSNTFLEKYPTLKRRIIVYPDAAPDWTSSAPTMRSDHDKIKVVYVGGLYSGRGMELLVKLAPLCPWARFTIVGGTEDQIVKWRSALPKGTENFGFLGRKPHTQVFRYMTSADVLVAPYQQSVRVHGNTGDTVRWMSPLKLFEYMAARRPIVASDLPVIREVLEHERNALLVDPTDPEAWRLALERIRSSPKFGEVIAKRAYGEFKQQYTWSVRVKRIMEALKRASERDDVCQTEKTKGHTCSNTRTYEGD